ncbi:MAG: winged helix-turn-helix transcriptional regulator [Chloroflexi bacterium]|nr:winged helix-turn-helix transcriptional regulator [Chloroflexota bacterium]
MRELTKAFQALSDETRLRILGLLLERECCVCEVMQALDISQTRASRNLNILYDTGLLKQRNEGLWSLYSIDREGMKGRFAGLVRVVEKALESNPVVALDRDKLKNAQRVGPGCGPQANKTSKRSTPTKGSKEAKE